MNIKELQDKIGYKFHDRARLKEALTHKSAKTGIPNERLEFLGDAVMDLIVGEFLFSKFPKLNEGELSKMRAAMVNEKAFANLARFWGLGELLYISRGEEANGGRNKDSILSDAFEAIIGAIYLESGFERTKILVLELISQNYKNISPKSLFSDYKTALQEITQERFLCIPRYEVLEELGPDHQKEFIMRILINEEPFATARAKSKKAAEQECARLAMEKLENEK